MRIRLQITSVELLAACLVHSKLRNECKAEVMFELQGKCRGEKGLASGDWSPGSFPDCSEPQAPPGSPAMKKHPPTHPHPSRPGCQEEEERGRGGGETALRQTAGRFLTSRLSGAGGLPLLLLSPHPLCGGCCRRQVGGSKWAQRTPGHRRWRRGLGPGRGLASFGGGAKPFPEAGPCPHLQLKGFYERPKEADLRLKEAPAHPSPSSVPWPGKCCRILFNPYANLAPTGIISCTSQVQRRKPGSRPGRGLGGPGPAGGGWGPGVRAQVWGGGTYLEIPAMAHIQGLEERLRAGHLYPHLFPQPAEGGGVGAIRVEVSPPHTSQRAARPPAQNLPNFVLRETWRLQDTPRPLPSTPRPQASVFTSVKWGSASPEGVRSLRAGLPNLC